MSSAIIADHRLASHFDAKFIQFRGKKEGIGVHPVGRKEFRAYGDDFSFHWLDYEHRSIKLAAANLRHPSRG